MQGYRAGTIAELHLQGLLAAEESAEVRHRPVQLGQLQKTLHYAQGLAQRLAKQALDAQEELDRHIRKRLTAPSLVTGRSQPLHIQVEPHRQRATGLGAAL